jgi:hypothetical protein
MSDRIRALLSRPFAAFFAAVAGLAALAPTVALSARPGEGEPFGIDWTPIVFWAIIGAVLTGGLLFGLLIDWGNR